METSTLLNGLLKQGFSSKPGDILKLQISDLQIRNIFDLVNTGKTNQFVLISRILYKKIDDKTMILVVPELLGKQIIFQCHNKLGFHFSKNQLNALLKPLIYHLNLKNIVTAQPNLNLT